MARLDPSIRRHPDPNTRYLDVSTENNPRAVALVDADDFERVNQYKWHVDTYGYVKRTLPRDENGKKGHEALHRFILDPDEGMQVDHVNHNPLDNRRRNIRVCTPAQNAANKGPNGDRAYKGVYEHMKSGWEAKIGFKGETVYLGLHRTATAAAVAYDIAAKALYGRFANLNFDAGQTPALSGLIKDALPAILETLGHNPVTEAKKTERNRRVSRRGSAFQDRAPTKKSPELQAVDAPKGPVVTKPSHNPVTVTTRQVERIRRSRISNKIWAARLGVPESVIASLREESPSA